MKNPVIRFIVATLAAFVALFAMVFIFTLLKLKGVLILMINAFVAITVWQLVYSLGAKEDKEDGLKK